MRRMAEPDGSADQNAGVAREKDEPSSPQRTCDTDDREICERCGKAECTGCTPSGVARSAASRPIVVGGNHSFGRVVAFGTFVRHIWRSNHPNEPNESLDGNDPNDPNDSNDR
jgi:hypothetical protein